MKNTFLTITFLFITLFLFSQETGTFTDSRDGKTYKTVKIGDQWWMAENLNFETDRSICLNKDSLVIKYSDVIVDTSIYKLLSDPNICTKYGRLYDFDDALIVCPKGWHIPSNNEWNILINYLGGDSIAGARLKAVGKEFWNRNSEETNNSSGFSAMATTVSVSTQAVTNFWSFTLIKKTKQPRIFELFDQFNSVHTQPVARCTKYCLRCLMDNNSSK